MELPQTYLIIRHLNAKVVKQHYNGNLSNSTSWKCVEKCNDILTSGDCLCLSKDTNITCNDAKIPDAKIPMLLWSLCSFILLILVVELLAIR